MPWWGDNNVVISVSVAYIVNTLANQTSQWTRDTLGAILDCHKLLVDLKKIKETWQSDAFYNVVLHHLESQHWVAFNKYSMECVCSYGFVNMLLLSTNRVQYFSVHRMRLPPCVHCWFRCSDEKQPSQFLSSFFPKCITSFQKRVKLLLNKKRWTLPCCPRCYSTVLFNVADRAGLTGPLWKDLKYNNDVKEFLC